MRLVSSILGQPGRDVLMPYSNSGGNLLNLHVGHRKRTDEMDFRPTSVLEGYVSQITFHEVSFPAFLSTLLLASIGLPN